MSYNIDFNLATSAQIEKAICGRLESIRLSRNITQAQLAKEAGISSRTIIRLEKGEGISFDTLIRVLMALGIQQNLETLLPDPSVRPIEQINIKRNERQRARPRSKDKTASWSWGNGEDDDD